MGLDVGLKRKWNEEYVWGTYTQRHLSSSVPQNIGLFIVADGMGGHQNVLEAASLTTQTLVDFVFPALLQGQYQGEEWRLLVEGVQMGNQAIPARKIARGATTDRDRVGPTITADLIGTQLFVANVSDSRTYLFRPSIQGGFYQLTHDHSTVARLIEDGTLPPDAIYTHPRRNEIYRSLGNADAVEVEWFTHQLVNGDLLLLCSDGLWEMVRPQQMVHILDSPLAGTGEIAEQLVELARLSGGSDNIGLAVVQMRSISDASTLLYSQSNIVSI